MGLLDPKRHIGPKLTREIPQDCRERVLGSGVNRDRVIGE
jgi:hypothetical protein